MVSIFVLCPLRTALLLCHICLEQAHLTTFASDPALSKSSWLACPVGLVGRAWSPVSLLGRAWYHIPFTFFFGPTNAQSFAGFGVSQHPIIYSMKYRQQRVAPSAQPCFFIPPGFWFHSWKLARGHSMGRASNIIIFSPLSPSIQCYLRRPSKLIRIIADFCQKETTKSIPTPFFTWGPKSAKQRWFDGNLMAVAQSFDLSRYLVYARAVSRYSII